MKTLKVVLSAIVLLYFVKDAKCGVIELELHLTEEEATIKARNILLEKLYGILISGYEAATQILDDMLNKDDDDEHLEGLYQKVDEEIKKLEEKEKYILSIEEYKPELAVEAEESRKVIEQVLDEHKRIHDTLPEKIEKEGTDAVRRRLDEVNRAVKDGDYEEKRQKANSYALDFIANE